MLNLFAKPVLLSPSWFEHITKKSDIPRHVLNILKHASEQVFRASELFFEIVPFVVLLLCGKSGEEKRAHFRNL